MGLFYGALFLIYGVHLPFFSVWLDDRGLSVEQISIIVAAPLFARIVLAPLLASRADKSGRHRSIAIALAATAVMFASVLAILPAHFWPIALAAFGFSIGFTSVMPMAESIAVTGVRRAGFDYGRMRLWGSATFILASFVGGAAVESYGEGIVIWLLLAAAALTFGASTLLPAETQTQPTASAQPQHTKKQPSQPSPQANLGRLLKSPVFLLFLVCAGFSQAAHATYYAFGTLHWLHQGISPLWAGMLCAIGVIAEIALFSYSRALVKLTGPVALMAIGALAGVVRWSAMAFDPGLHLLIPLQLLHAFTYGATHIGAVHFIERYTQGTSTATPQSLYGATGNGIAMGAATLLSGVLFAWFSGQTYFAMAAIAFVALCAAVALHTMWPLSLIHI